MPKKLVSEEEAFHPVDSEEEFGEDPAQSKKEAAEEAREMALETPAGRFMLWSLCNPTHFEKNVYKFLGGEFNPWGFRPQVPMFGYTLDFYSNKYMLDLEADGPDHISQVKDDRHRDAVLLEKGIRTIRLRPIDFVRHSKQQIFSMIEEFVKPKHVLGANK